MKIPYLKYIKHGIQLLSSVIDQNVLKTFNNLIEALVLVLKRDVNSFFDRSNLLYRRCYQVIVTFKQGLTYFFNLLWLTSSQLLCPFREIVLTARFYVRVLWLDISTRFSSVRSVQVQISLRQLLLGIGP